MPARGGDFWERSWKRDRDRDYASYAAPYYRLASPEIDVFRAHDIRAVWPGAGPPASWTPAGPTGPSTAWSAFPCWTT